AAVDDQTAGGRRRQRKVARWLQTGTIRRIFWLAGLALDPVAFTCHMRPMNKPLADADSTPQTPLAAEVERRRTFAIISHPDAGKTTLTEKLLLFGGAINLAGQV